MAKLNKILILAANCFSGQDLVDLMLEDPARQIIGVGRSPESSPAFAKYKNNANAQNFSYQQFDINSDADALLKFIDQEQPEAIVNFAAQGEVGTSWQHPEQWFETNAVALARIVNHLRQRDYLQKFLQISTPEVYGSVTGGVAEDTPINPSTPYAAAKAAGDLVLSAYAKQFDFPLVTVRATNVYGAGQQLYRIIPRTIIRLKLGEKIELHGGGLAEKSYIHIRDVSAGELAILEDGSKGETYHLSPDDSGIRICDLVAKICQEMGESFEETTTSTGERPGQDAAYVIDSSKARETLNWGQKINLDEGIKEVIEWVEQNWQEISDSEMAYQYRP
jgi:dTDP-glucose 4,6-dehydratase